MGGWAGIDGCLDQRQCGWQGSAGGEVGTEGGWQCPARVVGLLGWARTLPALPFPRQPLWVPRPQGSLAGRPRLPAMWFAFASGRGHPPPTDALVSACGGTEAGLSGPRSSSGARLGVLSCCPAPGTHVPPPGSPACLRTPPAPVLLSAGDSTGCPLLRTTHGGQRGAMTCGGHTANPDPQLGLLF